jgi:maleate cis-trans isomerase
MPVQLIKPTSQSIPKDLSRQVWEAQSHADRASESAQVAQGYADLTTSAVNRYSVRQDTNDENTRAAIAQSARIESQFRDVRNTVVMWGCISGVASAAIASLIFTQAPKAQIIERTEVQLQPQYFTTTTTIVKPAPKLSKKAGG